MTWVHFEEQIHFEVLGGANFSTGTLFFIIETENVQVVCDRCLCGHHIVAPTMEGGIFRSRKPKFAPYWWLGGAFECKYILNCKAVPNISTITTNFSIYTKDVTYLPMNPHLSFVWLVLHWQMALYLLKTRNLQLVMNSRLPSGAIACKKLPNLTSDKPVWVVSGPKTRSKVG